MIHRHRASAHKVYLPSNSRYNQYLLAEFKITDALLEKFQHGSDKLKPWQGFYEKLAEHFFTACEQAEIDHVHFIANDKLPRVRFSPEIRCWETEQQMLLFYNPAYHQSYKSHFDGSKRAQKVSLAFLANGQDIRMNAVNFHQKVLNMLTTFLPTLAVDASTIRLRDHQHLTYDLFAKSKGVEGTHSHTLRLIKNRYLASNFALPEQHDTISYVVASFPITRKLLKRGNIDSTAPAPYKEFYTMLADAALDSAKQHKLLNGAFIADGKSPIIRNSKKKNENPVGELRMLAYDPLEPRNVFECHCDDNRLVDYVQIIFAATQKDLENNGYAKFVETVDKALRTMAKNLAMDVEHDELTVRFHQHLAYHLK